MKVTSDHIIHKNYVVKDNKCLKIIKLISLVALSILLFPLFIPAYYRCIKKAYREIKSNKKITKTPLTLDEVVQSIKKKKIYKNKKEIIQAVNDITTPTGYSFSNYAQNFYQRFTSSLKNHESHPLIKRSMGKIMLHDKGMSTQWTMYMSGLALIATYLRRKNKLDNLFVCESLIAFQNKLKSIVANPNDTRQSLIVPLRCFQINQPDFQNQAQHKVTVGIEKKNGHLKIMIFEGQPNFYTNDILRGNFLKSLNQLKNSPHEPIISPLLWFINNCGINYENTRLYFSNVEREKSFGCATFALRDGVTFLQDPDFFEKIRLNQNPFIVKNCRIEKVDLLPPEFMKGAQSVSLLNKYFRENSELAEKQMKRGTKETWNLKDCLNDHEITKDNKKQNHYISSRCYKYHLIFMEALEQMKTEEFIACMKESLIEAPEDQLKNNKIMDDFHYLLNNRVAVQQR